MGRIYREVEVGDRRFWALFDSGSRHTYVVAAVADMLGGVPIAPRGVALGGRPHTIRESCILRGSIEGRAVDGEAHVIDDIGVDENGRPIDILIGAFLMQTWLIALVPDEERLDWSRYTRTFVEFATA